MCAQCDDALVNLFPLTFIKMSFFFCLVTLQKLNIVSGKVKEEERG